MEEEKENPQSRVQIQDPPITQVMEGSPVESDEESMTVDMKPEMVSR
jgi:hypothetical protein